MRTNIVIDDELMRAALEATGLPTKRAVVEAALKLIVRPDAPADNLCLQRLPPLRPVQRQQREGQATEGPALLCGCLRRGRANPGAGGASGCAGGR